MNSEGISRSIRKEKGGMQKETRITKRERQDGVVIYLDPDIVPGAK
uniref:Uncharacterized protein n=1 Tax=Arundo donax TaxID=35708 RepID=A0A0A9HJC7_ARUDO